MFETLLVYDIVTSVKQQKYKKEVNLAGILKFDHVFDSYRQNL